MSEELLENLDAINNVRPEVIKLKRKYFDQNDEMLITMD